MKTLLFIKKLLLLIVLGTFCLTGIPANGAYNFGPGSDAVVIAETVRSDRPLEAKYKAKEQIKVMIMELGETCRTNDGVFTVVMKPTWTDGRGTIDKMSEVTVRARVACE